MKIYEALKEMLENGKTIKGGNYLYKIGHADWEDTTVLLSKFYDHSKWEVQGSFHVIAKEFLSEWEVFKDDSFSGILSPEWKVNLVKSVIEEEEDHE